MIVVTWPGSGHAAVLFIGHVSTVIVSIANPSCWDTTTCVSALERVRRTRSSCIQQKQLHPLIRHHLILITKIKAVLCSKRTDETYPHSTCNCMHNSPVLILGLQDTATSYSRQLAAGVVNHVTILT